jgi:hypothetical protein
MMGHFAFGQLGDVESRTIDDHYDGQRGTSGNVAGHLCGEFECGEQCGERRRGCERDGDDAAVVGSERKRDADNFHEAQRRADGGQCYQWGSSGFEWKRDVYADHAEWEQEYAERCGERERDGHMEL